MAISVVQEAQIGAFNNPPITFGSNVTAGNTVLLAIAAFHSGAGTVTTSAPTLGGSPVTGSTAFFDSGITNGINSVLGADGVVSYCAIWMLPDCPGGSTTIGWTTSGQSGFVGCFAIEVAGLGTTPVLDQSSSNSSGTSTSVATGSTGSIVTAPEIIFAAAAVAESYSNQPGAPWTVYSPSSSGNGGYQIAVSSGSNYSWSQTASGSGAWTAGIVTLAASLPALPAPLYPLQRPARAKRLPRRGGSAAANPGGPVRNPNVVTAYGAHRRRGPRGAPVPVPGPRRIHAEIRAPAGTADVRPGLRPALQPGPRAGPAGFLSRVQPHVPDRDRPQPRARPAVLPEEPGGPRPGTPPGNPRPRIREPRALRDHPKGGHIPSRCPVHGVADRIAADIGV